jgi:hypothetical protein
MESTEYELGEGLWIYDRALYEVNIYDYIAVLGRECKQNACILLLLNWFVEVGNLFSILIVKMCIRSINLYQMVNKIVNFSGSHDDEMKVCVFWDVAPRSLVEIEDVLEVCSASIRAMLAVSIPETSVSFVPHYTAQHPRTHMIEIVVMHLLVKIELQWENNMKNNSAFVAQDYQ